MYTSGVSRARRQSSATRYRRDGMCRCPVRRCPMQDSSKPAGHGEVTPRTFSMTFSVWLSLISTFGQRKVSTPSQRLLKNGGRSGFAELLYMARIATGGLKYGWEGIQKIPLRYVQNGPRIKRNFLVIGDRWKKLGPLCSVRKRSKLYLKRSYGFRVVILYLRRCGERWGLI